MCKLGTSRNGTPLASQTAAYDGDLATTADMSLVNLVERRVKAGDTDQLPTMHVRRIQSRTAGSLSYPQMLLGGCEASHAGARWQREGDQVGMTCSQLSSCSGEGRNT